MRTHTNDFKNTIKELGRQIDGKIFYYPNYNIISESGDTILTETDIELVSEQFDKSNATEIDSQLIYSIDIVKNGQLLQSLMKELDVELKYELNIGSVINAKFGLLVNDSYEYLDYGNYIVYSKEFNLDTETWNYVCYDMMLFSMIKYRPLSVTYPITIRSFIGAIATKMGVGFANSDDTFTNYDQLINEDIFKNKGYTLRDILDKLSQITASNILINDNDELEVSYVNKIKNNNSVTSNQIINIKAVEEPISNLQIKGDTTQNGTPVPTNPIEIQKVIGDQTVNIIGKNLFNNSTAYSTSSATYTVADDKVTINCSSANQNCYVAYRNYNVKPSTNYNFSYNAEADNIAGYVIRAYKLDGTYTTIQNFVQDTNASYHFITTNDTNFISIFLYASRNNSSGVVNNKTTYSNIQLEEGLTATAYESYKSQNFLLSLPVANLFDKSTATYKNSRYINTEGVETSSSTSGYLTSYVKVMPNTEYTLSGKIRVSNSTGAIYFYDVSKTWISRVSWTGSSNVNYFTFTTPSDCCYIQFQYTMSVYDANTIQICEGTATTYWDYGTTQLELCKIGNYEDTIFQNIPDNPLYNSTLTEGSWYKYSQIGKKVLDGSEGISPGSGPQNEGWRKSTTTDNDRFIYDIKSTNRIYGISSANCYCNYFTYNSQNVVSSWRPNIGTGNIITQLVFNYTQYNTTTLEQWLIWLGTHNLIMYMLLNTPSYTEITDTTLVSQLEALASATLYNGTNNIIMNDGLNPYLKFDYVTDYETLNEEYLKDINVAFGKNFGPINRISISDTDNNLEYYAEDSTSIKQNELTQVNIIDNELAFNGEEQTIANNILTKLNGLYYSINDFETTGVCYYDYLDIFNVEAKNKTYQCLLLNNEISITQGIKESIFTEELEDTETSSNNYETSLMSDKQVQFKINQQEGKMESKVEKDGVISAINQSAEEIKIQANKLSFEGATIDMTADNIKIKGENLDIDSDGMITLMDNTADESQIKNASYKIESNYDEIFQGDSVHVGYVHQIFANGRQDEYENDNNISGSSGYGHYFGGISENLYRYPSTTWYMKSDDFAPGYTNGNYTSISVGVQGINTSRLLNGTWTYGFSVSVDGDITCHNIRYSGSLTPVSSSIAEKKKNFEKLTNAKEILNETDIYKYNMKEEKNTDKKHIGFVIGEDFNYSKEITLEDNTGVNIYSMVSVLWQVVKEQQEEINQLKEMIKNGKY